MPENKTIKQLIEEKQPEQARRPLYSEKETDSIKKAFERWKTKAVSKDKNGNIDFSTIPQTLLGSGVPRNLLYTPLDVPDLDYSQDIGFSGEEPYTRGVHANMYRGRGFTIRQICGFGGPEDTNERIRFLLKQGATGVSIVFDLPTIQEYDSDDPMALEQVGMGGVAIDSIEDMERLFQDIPLDKMSVSLVTHYPTNTAILFSMYLAMAERRGIPWDRLIGSVQNDFVMEEVVRGAPEYIPPDDCFRIQCDNIEFIRKNIPRWNCITLNGYNLREAGTSGITEASVAISNAVDTFREMNRRGYSVDSIAERFAFFWDICNDFFEEIARLRGARRLWYKIMKYAFDVKSERAMWMRSHAQTSGLSLSKEEPMNNIVRAAYQALAAVLGGVQSLHVCSYDEAYSVPTEIASMVSVRTQQIIQEETATTQTVDPLGGSFYIESLTREMESRILDEVDEIEKMGGIVKAVTSGWLHKKVIERARRDNEMLERGEIKMVGYNYAHADNIEIPKIDVFSYPKDTGARQAGKLKKLRQQRDNRRVEACLKSLEEECRRGGNIMPHCLEAAKANATEGEMAKIFQKAFGLWKPPAYW